MNWLIRDIIKTRTIFKLTPIRHKGEEIKWIIFWLMYRYTLTYFVPKRKDLPRIPWKSSVKLKAAWSCRFCFKIYSSIFKETKRKLKEENNRWPSALQVPWQVTRQMNSPCQFVYSLNQYVGGINVKIRPDIT